MPTPKKKIKIHKKQNSKFSKPTSRIHGRIKLSAKKNRLGFLKKSEEKIDVLEKKSDVTHTDTSSLYKEEQGPNVME